MNNSLANSIYQYLRKNNCHYLLLLSTISVVIVSSDVVSIAAPIKIAQVNTIGKINRPILKLGSKGEGVLELQAALKLLGFYTGTVNGNYQESTARAVAEFKQAAGLKPDGIVDVITWQKLFPQVSTVATNQASSVVTPTTSNRFVVPTQPRRNTRVNQPVVRKPTPAKKVTTSPKKPQTSFRPTPLNQRNPNIQYTSAGWPILRLGNTGAEVMKLQRLLKNLGFLRGAIDGNFGVGTEAAVKAAQIRYGLQADGVVGGATWNTFVGRLR